MQFTDSVLSISNDTGSIRFLEYSVNSQGAETTGTVDDYELSKEIGTLYQGNVVFGSITFNLEDAGLNPIDVKIVSELGEVLSDTITIEAEEALALEIDVLPKTLVPLIDNELLIRVTDGENPVSIYYCPGSPVRHSVNSIGPNYVIFAIVRG